MRKIKVLLVSFLSIFILNINVYAASGNLSVNKDNVYVGGSFTVTVNINSAAAWNIHVTASGPVSGCTINQVDATADAMDTNKTFSTTCTATNQGTIIIKLSGDVTSASDGNAVNISKSMSIQVSQMTTTQKPNNNNNANNSHIDTRSKNNNIRELSVDGYELVKVDNKNYTLTIPYDKTSINVNITAEDSKSRITGAGTHSINIGENNIEVIITAENGSQNKINIKVIRKDGFYLEDLPSLLENGNIDDININIKNDTKITTEYLEMIKNSGKTVNFNYYDDDKLLLYSWIIDGAKLDKIDELMTTITNDSENRKEILRLSNYADGLFIVLKKANNFSKGVKVKYFVKDKYDDNDLINIYEYIKINDKLELIKNELVVKNSYVEFDLTSASDYFITMSNIPNDIQQIENSSSCTLLIIIIVALSSAVVCLVVTFIIRNKKDKVKVSNKSDNVAETNSLIR